MSVSNFGASGQNSGSRRCAVSPWCCSIWCFLYSRSLTFRIGSFGLKIIAATAGFNLAEALFCLNADARRKRALATVTAFSRA